MSAILHSENSHAPIGFFGEGVFPRLVRVAIAKLSELRRCKCEKNVIRLLSKGLFCSSEIFAAVNRRFTTLCLCRLIVICGNRPAEQHLRHIHPRIAE